jgi:hypothetical protein
LLVIRLKSVVGRNGQQAWPLPDAIRANRGGPTEHDAKNTVTLADWDRCERWLAPSIAAGPAFGTKTTSLRAYRQAVADGRFRLLGGDGSAVLFEFVDFPDHRAVLVAVAGGDLAELTRVLIPLVELVGLTEGCARAMIGGRKGWSRALRRSGYAAAGSTPIGWFAVKTI